PVSGTNSSPNDALPVGADGDAGNEFSDQFCMLVGCCGADPDPHCGTPGFTGGAVERLTGILGGLCGRDPEFFHVIRRGPVGPIAGRVPDPGGLIDGPGLLPGTWFHSGSPLIEGFCCGGAAFMYPAGLPGFSPNEFRGGCPCDIAHASPCGRFCKPAGGPF